MDVTGRAALSMGSGHATLVWFPAIGDTAASFGRTAMRLVQKTRGVLQVLAFDPPGYGSAGGSIPPFSFLYDWAAALTDELGRAGTPLVLSGNSSGADLALAAAVRSNARVAGCLFVCWPDWRLGRSPTSNDLCPRDESGLGALLFRSWHRPPVLSKERRALWVARLADARYRAHVDSFDAEEHGHMLDQLGVPLEFIGGQSDRLVPPTLLEDSADAHRCPLVLVEQAGHYPQKERPADLAELMTATVDRWLCRYQEIA